MTHPHVDSLRRFTQDTPFALEGKFHSHITLRMQHEQEVERLRRFCRAHRVKLTVIELGDFNTQAQRDVMTTQHHKYTGEDAMTRVLNQIGALVDALVEEQFEVTRVKLEHESMPTLPVFSKGTYREVHIKLHIPHAEYDEVMQTLAAQASSYGFVPSSNPNERRDAYIAQFLNLRFYKGDAAQAQAHVDTLTEHLSAQGLHVAQVKSETTILDTNQGWDAWWMA
jgi:hypothetical protein